MGVTRKTRHGWLQYAESLDRPMNIAHRGASEHAPENTLAAFELALRLGAEAIELDVHLSYDGVPVVIHDRELERTTNGEGFVDSYPLQELKKFDAASWFSRKYRGEKIPTWGETLDFVRGRAYVNVEIKGGSFHYPGIEEKVVRLVEEKGLEEYTTISSYELPSLHEVKKINPFLPTSLRISHRDIDWSRDMTKLVDAINLSQFHINKEKVLEVHRHHLLLNVYTVNDRKIMRRLVADEVDGIFTDRPDMLKSILLGPHGVDESPHVGGSSARQRNQRS